MKAQDLLKTKYGTAHSGAQHFSKYNGKEYSWNFVAKHDGKFSVVLRQEDADGIACAGKFFPLPVKAAASSPEFLQDLLQSLQEHGSRQAYVDSKLGCVSIKLNNGQIIQIFEGAKPSTIEVWEYQPPKPNKEMSLVGPTQVKAPQLFKLLLSLGAKF